MYATNTGPYKVVVSGEDVICVGETTQMEAYGAAGAPYTWSANGDISVSANGEVTGLEPGIATVIATDAGGCSGEKEIVVLKVELSTNLWWFAGENPGGGYDIQATLTVAPVTTGTFKWDVTAGTSIVDLNNGGTDADSITANDDNNVTVKSTGASSSMGVRVRAVTSGGRPGRASAASSPR